jgi:autotransporter translocation and assembly factor TamB
MPASSETTTQPRRRIRTLILALAGLGVFALVALAALWVGLETRWGMTTAVRAALSGANPWPGTALTIGDARGGFLGGIALHDVRLTRADGVVLVKIDTLEASYDISRLLGKPVSVRSIRVAGIDVHARQLPSGLFDLLEPFMSGKPAGKPGAGFALTRLEITRGVIALAMPRLGRDSVLSASALTTRASRLAFGKASTLSLDTLAAVLVAPAPPTARLELALAARLEPDRLVLRSFSLNNARTHAIAAGTITLPAGKPPRFDGTDVSLRMSPLAGEDIAHFLPMLGNPGDVTLEASARGERGAFAVRLDGRASRGGHASIDANISGAGGPVSVTAHGRVMALDLGALRGGVRDSFVVSALWSVDLAGQAPQTISGPYSLDLAGTRVGPRRFETATIKGQFTSGQTTFTLDALGDDLALVASGELKPFEPAPEYAVRGTLTVPADFTTPRDTTGASLRGRRPFYAGDIAFSIDGKGVTPDSAVTRADIETHPLASSGSLIGAGTIQLYLEHGLADVETDIAASGGRIRAAGDFKFGREPAYTLKEAEIAGVEWTAFIGDTTRSRIDARLHGAGRGFDLRTASVSADVDSLFWRYGPHEITAGRTEVRIERDHSTLATSVIADGARIEAHASLGSLVPLRDAELEASVRGLDLARVTADTAYSSHLALQLQARLADPAHAGETKGSAHLDCAPDSIGHQRLDEFALDATLEHGDARVIARLVSSFGRVHLTASGRPFDPVPSLRIDPLTFENVDLAAIPGASAFPTRLTGALTASVAGRAANTLHGEAKITLDGSRVRTAAIDRFVASARLATGRLDVEVDARAASDRLSASLRGEPFADPMRLTARGDVSVPSLGRWLGRDSVTAALKLSFDAGITQPRAGGLARAVAFANIEGRGHGAEVTIDTIGTAARLENGVLHLDRLVLRGNVLRVDGSGRIGLPRLATGDSTSMQLQATLLDPEPLASWFGGTVTTARRAQFRFNAYGSFSAPRFSGALTAGGPHYGGSWADSIALAFSGAMRDSVLASFDAKLDARTLVISLLRPRDLHATAKWDGKRLAVDAHSVVDSARAQEITFQVEPTRTGLVGRLERLDARARGAEFALAHPVDFELGKRLHIDDLMENDNGVTVFRAHGGISAEGAADIECALDSLDVSDAFDLLGIENLKGRLSATASLTGTRQRPVVKGSMRAHLTAGSGKPAALTGAVRCDHDTLGISFAFEQAPGNRLAFAATMPYGLNLAPPAETGMLTRTALPMAARLDVKRFGFAWFAPLISPRVVRKPAGWLDGAVTASGNPEAPTLGGTLSLNDLEAELPPLGASYKSGHARLEFGNRTIHVREAGLKSAGGTVAVKGDVTLEGRERQIANLTTTFHKFVVMNTAQAKATLSGALTLTGPLHTPTLHGKLEALETTIYAEASEARRVEPVTLTRADRIQVLERFGVDLTAAREDSISAADSVDVDVTMNIGKNVWVRRHSDPILALELRGSARLKKPAGAAIDVSGDIGVITGRSYLSFTGRRFDITRAEVNLPGPIDKARGSLNAVYQPSANSSGDNVVVTAAVTIDSAGVDTRLSSQPYLDQASLLNYLLTGQVQGGAQSGTAYGLAVGSAIGAVGGVAGRKLGLDVVQVTMDAYGGQTLSAGSYVDPRLYLGFRQPVVQAQTTSSNNSSGSTPQTEFEAEFEAWKRVLFNVQGSSTQYRFFLKPPLGR